MKTKLLILAAALAVSSTSAQQTVFEYPDGLTVKFNPNGTRAGFNVGSHAGDPSAVNNGDAWYNSSSGLFKIRANGQTITLGEADLSNLNASNLTSGTIPDARFPATLPALSGVNLTALNASALASGTLPDACFPATLPALNGAALTTLNASALASGTLPGGRFPALTGDVTTTAGALATTLATVNANVGSFGSSTAIPTFTVNGKGLITAASTAALGTIATQNASAVEITGGTVSGLTAPVKIGAGTAGALSGNPGVTLTGSVSTTAHGYSDERTYNVGTTESFNSIDLIPQLNGRTGGAASVHFAGLQFRPKQLSGTFTNMYGLVCQPEFTGGTTTSLRNINVIGPAISGGATVTTVYGIQFGDLKPPGVTYGVSIASDYSSTVMWHVGNAAFGYGSIPPTDAQMYVYPSAANKTAIRTSNFSLTGSTAIPMLDLVGATWNTSGTPTLIKANVTDTASNAASLLMDLQVGGVSKFKVSKGGVVTNSGTATNDSVSAGQVGEYATSLVPVGSAVTLTTGTAANVTSISLTAGDWDVEGNVNYTASGATITGKVSGTSSTSATIPTDGTEVYSGVTFTLGTATDGTTLARKRFSLASTTTIYLVGQCDFSAGTVTAFGALTARRVR